MKFFLFICIIFSNMVFGIPWLYGITEAYAILLISKNPKIAKFICCCFVKNKRFRRFATIQGIDMSQIVNKAGPEPIDESFSDKSMEFSSKSLPDTPENSICEVQTGLANQLDKPKLTVRTNIEEITFRAQKKPSELKTTMAEIDYGYATVRSEKNDLEL